MINVRIRAGMTDPRNQILKKLSERVLRQAAARAAWAALEVLAEEARRRAPVDTGALRDSIAVREFDDELAFGRVDVGKHYAHFVEFGTAYQAAQPFLRPAVIDAAGDMVVAAGESLRDDIRDL